MGCAYQYSEFFRFRSAIGIKDGILAERNRLFWLVNPFKLIDFNYDILLAEAFGIGQNTNVFSYSDLRDMDFKSYELIIMTIEKANKKGKADGS